MDENVLKGIIMLFAIQAAMHPETDWVRPRLFLELYLRPHILLSQPEVYQFRQSNSSIATAAHANPGGAQLG